MNQKVYLVLFGGLGNQLFQFANALDISGDNEIIILARLGNPRIQRNGNIELQEFNLPNNVKIDYHLASKTLTKLLSYLLSRNLFQLNLIRKFKIRAIKLIAEILASIKLRTRINISISSNIGYSAKFDRTTNMPIGYFQSIKGLNSSTITTMKRMKIHSFSKIQKIMNEKYVLDNALVLHIRMGDYRNESKIGMLKKEYFLNALDQFNCEDNRHIMLFSDEYDSAFKYIPDEFKDRIIRVNSYGLNSAEVLEQMRYGKDYIISNSTFSWWAAFMSYSKNPCVIAPEPWFVSGVDVSYIIPDNWNTVSRK